MSSRLTWFRLPNGSQQAKQHPIRLVKPARGNSAPGWLIATPVERDSNYADGWAWAPVYDPHRLTPLEAFSIPEARALALEHVDHLLTTIPADYGKPAAEDAEDAAALAQHDAEVAAGTLKTVPHAEARERLGVGTADAYEQLGVRRPNANGWPVLLELSSVQFEALFKVSSVLSLGDVSEFARPMGEIHTKLVNLDPRDELPT